MGWTVPYTSWMMSYTPPCYTNVLPTSWHMSSGRPTGDTCVHFCLIVPSILAFIVLRISLYKVKPMSQVLIFFLLSTCHVIRMFLFLPCLVFPVFFLMCQCFVCCLRSSMHQEGLHVGDGGEFAEQGITHIQQNPYRLRRSQALIF